jgi:hypothetical protein
LFELVYLYIYVFFFLFFSFLFFIYLLFYFYLFIYFWHAIHHRLILLSSTKDINIYGNGKYFFQTQNGENFCQCFTINKNNLTCSYDFRDFDLSPWIWVRTSLLWTPKKEFLRFYFPNSQKKVFKPPNKFVNDVINPFCLFAL